MRYPMDAMEQPASGLQNARAAATPIHCIHRRPSPLAIDTHRLSAHNWGPRAYPDALARARHHCLGNLVYIAKAASVSVEPEGSSTWLVDRARKTYRALFGIL